MLQLIPNNKTLHKSSVLYTKWNTNVKFAQIFTGLVILQKILTLEFQ